MLLLAASLYNNKPRISNPFDGTQPCWKVGDYALCDIEQFAKFVTNISAEWVRLGILLSRFGLI